ncbi:MAG: NAD-dependent epimerase/dehydratase family protein [Actinomycetia bacterium]|nr:NAD-dependent epimerase/dehydratase family protein [Actinomycetes bacterium]
MTVLIAGCGDLGTEVGLRYAATGREVVGLRRTPGHLPDAIVRHEVDLAREVPTVPADTEILVVATAADRRTEQAYRSAYLDGLSNLLAGMRRGSVRPRRVLLVSSTAVYGDNRAAWVDESTPVSPGSPTAAVLRDAEQLLHEHLPSAIVFRLAGLYGPGRMRLLDQVCDGSAGGAGDPARYTNRIHRDDAAAAIVHLTTACADPDPIYLGSDHEPTLRSEVVHFLAGELGVELPDDGSRRAGVPNGRRCRNDRLRSTGFTFRYPTYREGYRAVIAGHAARHR